MEAAKAQRRIPFWFVWTCVTAFLAVCLAYAMEKRKVAEIPSGNGLVEALFAIPHTNIRLIGHGNDTFLSIDVGTGPSTGDSSFKVRIVRVSLDGKESADNFPVLLNLEAYQAEEHRFSFEGVKPDRSQRHRVRAELHWTTPGGEGSILIDRSYGYW